MKKIRLNLDLTPKAKDALVELQERTEASSMIEVIRRAIALYDLAASKSLEGAGLFIKRPDGTETEIVLL